VQENQGHSEALTSRVYDLQRVVLGANLGFLPFMLIFLVTEARYSIATSVILWLLTTWVIINEWWSMSDTFRTAPSNSRSIVFISLLYTVGLLCLPACLLVTETANVALGWYVGLLLFLSLLDIPFSLLYRAEPDISATDQRELLTYAYFDIFLVILYGIALYLTLTLTVLPLVKVIIVAVFYLLEFVSEHRFVPHIARQFS